MQERPARRALSEYQHASSEMRTGLEESRDWSRARRSARRAYLALAAPLVGGVAAAPPCGRTRPLKLSSAAQEAAVASLRAGGLRALAEPWRESADASLDAAELAPDVMRFGGEGGSGGGVIALTISRKRSGYWQRRCTGLMRKA